ncbi:15703_t:CDS:2, partial [Racocetra persica]
IGRQSFILSQKLYNPTNSQKSIESNVIISYTNANVHYDLLKESLKKSIISAIGRLKLSPNKYNNQLDMIKEQYTTMSSQPPNKRKRGSFFSSPTKPPNNTPQAVNLEQLVTQIRTDQTNA